MNTKIMNVLKAIEERWNTQNRNKEMQEQTAKLRFVSDYEEKYIAPNEIIALEVIGNHKLQVLTKHQIFESNGTLGDIEKESPNYFFRCHRSCIINIKEVVSKFKNNEQIIMSNGYKLQCAKRRQKAFLKLLENNN